MWEFAGQVAQIAVIDLALSGDNAVVIGMASRQLPTQERKKAIRYGVGAAILLRVALSAVASQLLRVPLLQAGGGVILLWIAYKLIKPDHGDETPEIAAAQSLGDSMRIIILADLSMSLDNVLAIGGVSHGNIWLMLFGLAFSIPFLLVSSNIIASLLTRHRWLNWLGIGILLWTAGQMVWEDPVVRRTVGLPPIVHSYDKAKHSEKAKDSAATPAATSPVATSNSVHRK